MKPYNQLHFNLLNLNTKAQIEAYLLLHYSGVLCVGKDEDEQFVKDLLARLHELEKHENTTLNCISR